MKTKRLTIAAALFLSRAAFADDYSHYKKASEDFRQQIYFSAISEARAQLGETPNHAPSWRLMAQIYLTLKKCSEASSAAASAYNIMIQPPIPTAEAQEEMSQILAELDAKCGTSLELGRLYSQSKDYVKAAAHYRGYLQRNPGDVETRLEYAHVLAWAKNYPASAEQYKRYLNSRPKEVPAILGLADVYVWSGDLLAAETQLKKALALEPGNGDALAKLAHVHEWQGQYKDAKTEYDQAVAVSPDNVSAREGQGRVKDLESSTQQRASPSEEIRAEIQKTGEQALFFKLGEALYHNDNNVDDALAAYRRYMREYPGDLAAKLKVARVLGWEKRYGEAVPLFRQYLQKNPDDVAVRLELANILSWDGRRSEALTELDLIKRQNPTLPSAYLAAGDIQRWQRNFPEARDNYKKVLKLDPDNASALEGLRLVDKQWSAEPILRLTGEKISVSDIDFRRTSEGAQAEFHLADGRVDVTPGGKDYQFKQQASSLKAKEAYLNAGMPIQNEWRWWGSVGGLQVENRPSRLEGSLGVEGTISTHTWMRVGYTSEDAVFESNNLSALLNGASLRLDSYDFQLARTLPGDNQIRGLASAGFLSDSNSRTRMLVEGLHELSDAPTVKVGVAYKALSFAQTSPLYWSPAAYGGPGLTGQLERHWDAFSYKAGINIFRITQTNQTESTVEGSIFYRPRHGFFAGISVFYGRGAGAAPEQGSTNTVLQDTQITAGYRF